jgi:diguanylate cyclase (GGDEF)-like protein
MSASAPLPAARADDCVWLTRADFLAAAEVRLANGKNTAFALMIVDIDAFHEINADHGFAAGDMVLRAVTRRVCETVPDAPCIGRLGADEFAVLLAGADADRDLERLAEDVHEALDSPIATGSDRVCVTASIGLARRDDECGVETLVMRAETAMRQAKTECRRSKRVHSHKTARAPSPLLRDHRELQEAIARNELSLAFQPVFDAKTGEMRSAEVLARWHHKTLGDISPGEFVPLAERSGLILELGWWAMTSAVAVLARTETLKLAVNVSPLQFRHHGFALRVQELLAAYRVAPTRLELEVTEGALIRNAEMAERTLRQVRAVGMSVALDDFGTGYSSLSYLQRLAFDKLKLDQSFVRGLQGKAENTRLLRSIIDLGHSLGVSVVAEGVETNIQASVLSMLGADLLQGYALGVPLDEAAFTAKYLRPASAAAADAPTLAAVTTR